MKPRQDDKLFSSAEMVVIVSVAGFLAWLVIIYAVLELNAWS